MTKQASWVQNFSGYGSDDRAWQGQERWFEKIYSIYGGHACLYETHTT